MKQKFFFSNFFANLFMSIFLFSLLISTSAKSNESDNLIIEVQEFSDFLNESMQPANIRICF